MGKEVKKPIPGMTLWGEVHEKLEYKKMTLISEMDEIIFELNENLKATLLKKSLKSLREHARLEDYVLKQRYMSTIIASQGRMDERITIQSIV